MAGHSKWKNIQHRKGKQDIIRGKIFTKLIRELTTASKMGGADPTGNPRLRLAMDKALDANMPRDTIDRAIKKGAGQLDDQNMEEILYEGYGPGGVAVMVECVSDNRNRTVSEVRHAFTKHGGNLGTSGSVLYLFQKRGELAIPAGINEDQLMDVVLSAGADDLTPEDDGTFLVTCPPEQLALVHQAIKATGITMDSAEVVYAPVNTVAVSGDTAASLLKMLDALENLDDVQEVFSNADIDARALDEYGR